MIVAEVRRKRLVHDDGQHTYDCAGTASRSRAQIIYQYGWQ